MWHLSYKNLLGMSDSQQFRKFSHLQNHLHIIMQSFFDSTENDFELAFQDHWEMRDQVCSNRWIVGLYSCISCPWVNIKAKINSTKSDLGPLYSLASKSKRIFAGIRNEHIRTHSTLTLKSKFYQCLHYQIGKLRFCLNTPQCIFYFTHAMNLLYVFSSSFGKVSKVNKNFSM